MTSTIVEIAEHNGLAVAMDMLQEECAELIQVINKHRRADSELKHEVAVCRVAEEIADVTIMIEQVAHLLNISDSVKAEIDFKLDRQKRRISDEK